MKEKIMNEVLEKEFGQRLVRLHNGTPGLRQGLHVRTSVPKDAGNEPVVDFISSDETADRYNEIISASGWELVSYLKNPVFQDSHDYSSITRTIGKAAITEVRGDKLFQRIHFAVDANPLAKIAYALYKGGFLNAVSVGFVPVKWQNGDSTTGYTRKYTKQILLETSAVAIPANPNALQLAFESGAVEKRDLRELLEMLRQVATTQQQSRAREQAVLNPERQLLKPLTDARGSVSSDSTALAVRSSNTSALGTTSNEAHQLVNLMRQVAALCRKA
jgi:HK97 family phage prohead protease